MQQKTRILIEQILQPLQNLKTQSDTQLRNYFYQSILFILEYIFSDKQIQAKNIDIDQKEVLVSYIEKFRNFVVQKKDENFLQITNKLIGKRYEQLNNEQEGFISSDDEKKRVTVVSTLFQDLFENQEFTKQQVQQIIKQKDDQILRLGQLVKQRDSTIIDLATRYLKEIQNMRDQMFRSEIREDYFHIQYFDVSIIEDEKLKELVNQKISNIKSLYEIQIRRMTESIQSQNLVIQNQRQDILILENKTQILQNVEYLVERIFFLEKNPYQIWKLIQNAVGCKFFHEVFENQKETSGIDYREVNKMLMSSKAYEREFEYFKKSIEDQMVVYLERAIDVIKQQDNSQSELLNNMAIQLSQQRQINSQLQQDLDKLNDNYQVITKMRIPEQEIDLRIYNKGVKKAFLVWKIINQQFNLNNIELNNSRKTIQELLYSKQMKIDLLSLQINLMTKELAEIKQNYQELKINHDDQIQILKITKRNHQEQMTINKNYKNCLQKIFNYLNLKLQINQFILLDNKNKEIKQFQDRINKVLSQKYGVKVIQELYFQLQKNNSALQHLNPLRNDIFTQTDQYKLDQNEINKNKIMSNNYSVKIGSIQDKNQNKIFQQNKQSQTDIQIIQNSTQSIDNYGFKTFKQQKTEDTKIEMVPEIDQTNHPQEDIEKKLFIQQNYQKSDQKQSIQDNLKLYQNIRQKPIIIQQEQEKYNQKLISQNIKDIQQTRSLNVSIENFNQSQVNQQINTPLQNSILILQDEIHNKKFNPLQIQTPLSTTTKHIQQIIQVQQSQQQIQINQKFLQYQKKFEVKQFQQLQYLQKMVFQNKECLGYAKEHFYIYLQFYQRLIDQIKNVDLRCTHFCKQYLNQNNKHKYLNVDDSKNEQLDHQNIVKSLNIQKIRQFQLPEQIGQSYSERISNKVQARVSKKQNSLFQTIYIKRQRAHSIDQSILYKHQLPQI